MSVQATLPVLYLSQETLNHSRDAGRCRMVPFANYTMKMTYFDWPYHYLVGRRRYIILYYQLYSCYLLTCGYVSPVVFKWLKVQLAGF
jgi:hypothetical protein